MATELLARLRDLGVEYEVCGEKLRLNAPPGAVSEELRATLREHKQEIVRRLQVEEAEERFRAGKSVVIIWSGVLNEKVALVAKEEAKRLVPEGLVTYTANEVCRLGAANLGAEALRIVHSAKKHVDGTIEEIEPEGSE